MMDFISHLPSGVRQTVTEAQGALRGKCNECLPLGLRVICRVRAQYLMMDTLCNDYKGL